MKLPAVLTRILSPTGPENRAEGYTNAAIDALIGSATGRKPEAVATAAAESAIVRYTSAFAVARVEGGQTLAENTLPGGVLADIARRLLTSGNYVAMIDVDQASGAIELLPASDYEIAGQSAQPRRWSYRLKLPAPGRQAGQDITRTAPSAGVVHILINPTPGAPWRGRSPLALADLSADLLAYLERSLTNDAQVPGGYLLPLPDGSTQSQANQVRNAMQRGKGTITPIEALTAFGPSSAAPTANPYRQVRWGGEPPQSSTLFHPSLAATVMGAMGVSPAILGDGAAAREAYRQLILGPVAALAHVMETELSTKLDATLILSFDATGAIDIPARSRAVKGLVDAGVPLAEALVLAGLRRR